MFALARIDLDRPVEFVLTSPTGKVFDLHKMLGGGGAPPGVTAFLDKAFQSISISNPEPGVWKMTASVAFGGFLGIGAGDPNIVQLFASVQSSGTDIELDIGLQSTSQFPNPIVLRATPTVNGQSVLGAKVIATVIRSDGSRVNTQLFDNGKKENGDKIANDGIYSALFTDYSSEGNGTYSFTARIDTTGLGVMIGGGEDFGGSSAPEPGDFAPTGGTRSSSATRAATPSPRSPRSTARAAPACEPYSPTSPATACRTWSWEQARASRAGCASWTASRPRSLQDGAV